VISAFHFGEFSIPCNYTLDIQWTEKDYDIRKNVSKRMHRKREVPVFKTEVCKENGAFSPFTCTTSAFQRKFGTEHNDVQLIQTFIELKIAQKLCSV